MIVIWSEFAERFRRLTQRERAFAAGLLAVLGVFAALSGFEAASAAAARASAAQARAAEAEALVATLSDADYQRRLGLETGKLWRSAFVDSSMAGVQAQALLAAETIAAQAGLSNPELSVVDEDLPHAGPVHVVRLTLSSDFDWQTFAALLEALQSAEPAFVPEDIELVSDPEANTMRITLRAPALLEAPQ
jgi:hypothetical protein